MQKIKYMLKAVIVISVVLALVLPSTAVITNTENKTNTKIQYKSDTATVTAIKKVLSTPQSLLRGQDVLVSSDNPDDDDSQPKIMVNKDKTIVGTYEKRAGATSTIIPVVYSEDNGATWTTQFEFDSSAADWEEGSGLLEKPDLAFSEKANNFFFTTIDPLATSYNVAFTWIPSDIANADSILISRYNWLDSLDYTYSATTNVGEWQIVFDIDSDATIAHHLGLGYYWYDPESDSYLNPVDVNPDWAAGGYYDGGSILKTYPASKPEMATGTNRIYVVAETLDEVAGISKISYKATYNDLDPASDTFLFTSGGGPSGMDKYCDIEVWAFQMYIAEDATDPDISAKGSRVAVVYTQNGDVKCKASGDDGANWIESTVETDAGYPCVFVANTMIYVAYVKDNNLFLMESDNLGNTWTYKDMVNDNDGTVVDEPGTANLGESGIMWTDNRNGANDIYFEYYELETNEAPGAPTITGPATGKHGASIEYSFAAIDPEGDQIAEYTVNWGDGSSDTIVGPFNSGIQAKKSHTWAEDGTYLITANAKDIYGLIGPDGTLGISIPKSRTISLRLLDYFPNAFPFLRMLLGV
jgi:hypothetical protein